MKNADKPAFPGSKMDDCESCLGMGSHQGPKESYARDCHKCDGSGQVPKNIPGLTKREYFAAKAMQAILGNNLALEGIISGNNKDAVAFYAGLGKVSCIVADALIKELEK